jgi:uncharacterized protein
MNHNEIRVALENAVGVPEEAMRAAVRDPAALAPAVLAVAWDMAGGRLPLLHEERLLRFGLHALAAARDTSACPAFLALLRRPVLEVEWLFGEDRDSTVAQLLLSLFDGDDAAVCELIADAGVDDYSRSGLMQALARLVWEGRASRERLLALLDRFDREALATLDSWAWFGWQEAILLLGVTDMIERVQQGWKAGRMSATYRDIDRQDWLEQTRKAAEQPDAPERFATDHLVPIDDPIASVEWSADPPSGPGERPSDDELAWVDTALLRTVPANLCMEEADGLLTALATGPVRVPQGEYLAAILTADGETSGFDSAEHKALVTELLTRHHDSLERDLAAGTSPEPWIYGVDANTRGALWARGYLNGIELRKADWQGLARERRLVDTLVMPFLVLLPDSPSGDNSLVSYEQRLSLLRGLPEIVLATKAYWQGEWHPLLEAPVERAPKIGRNDPCPCGSGKKYKRCCGVAA